MSDGISGIKIISPTYPVKPAQPSHKERESGKRQKDPHKPEIDQENDDDHNTAIDEYI
jgi:hypothetical protein